jgi:hypothetical protein
MYNSSTCQNLPFSSGTYTKATCSGGQVKVYSGSDSTCPDSASSSAYTDGACISGVKVVCNYSPPAGVLSNIYNSSDCSGSPSIGTLLPNGCFSTGSTYLSISCPSIRVCSDSACSQNCVTNSTLLNNCQSLSFGDGFYVKAVCSGASMIQGGLIALLVAMLSVVMFLIKHD